MSGAILSFKTAQELLSKITGLRCSSQGTSNYVLLFLQCSQRVRKKQSHLLPSFCCLLWVVWLCKPFCLPRKFCRNIPLLLIVIVLAATGTVLKVTRELLPVFWSTGMKSEPNKSQWEFCLWLRSSQDFSTAVTNTAWWGREHTDWYDLIWEWKTHACSVSSHGFPALSKLLPLLFQIFFEVGVLRM